MAASPILLVADDLAVIASVKRVLAREGYECVLATNAADAIIAWGHSLPGLILLQPGVESDRGGVVLEELANHPDAQLLRVVLLGESVPGFPWPVEPLPLDPAGFAQTIADNYRSGDRVDGWQVLETTPPEKPAETAETPHEADEWRATRPASTETDEPASPTGETELPERLPAPEAALAHEDEHATPPEERPVYEEGSEERPDRSLLFDEGETPPPVTEHGALHAASSELAEEEATGEAAVAAQANAEAAAQAEADAAAQAEADAAAQAEAAAEADVQPPRETPPEERLFNDLPDLEAAMHADVEAQAMASVESTLAAQPMDDELQRLEDEVRAEAQRRRVAREEKARSVPLVTREAPEPAPLPESAAPFESSESDFSGLSDEASAAAPAEPTLPSRAAEMLARAEQLLLEGRAAAEARRREADAEAKRQRADVEAAERRAENTESLLRQEREARAIAEATAEQLKAALDAEAQRAAELEGALATTRAELEGVRAELAETIAQRDEKSAALDEARVEVDALSSQLESDATAAKAQADELAQVKQALAEAQARADSAEHGVTEAEARADTTLRRAEQAEQALADLRSHAEDDTRRAEAAEQSLAEAVEARDEAREQLAAATARATTLEADLGATTDKLDEASNERDALKAQLGVTQGDLERTTGELERALGEIAALTRAAEESRAELAAKDKSVEELTTRAEAAEDRAALAQEKADSLEKQAVAPLALPGNRTVGVPRTGTVDLEGLAHLVGQLALAQADGRLELGIPGGTRTLWFKRGAVIAAESTLEYESLVDRARRDGLIDARQEAELRMLKSATPREQLEAMKGRGVIRDIESVPLVQRYTEQTTLEAFTEPSTNYRLADDPPADAVLIATVPRATLPMLAESLRRAIPPDVLLERLGGGEAVPEPTDSELDLRALGFSERERKMLTWVDGEATVEDLSLASGLKPDVAFRALLVAKLLGVVTLTTPEKPARPADPDLDVRRLEAKYDEVQDADYFTILGLPRSAGADDVQRAFQRLGGEFDPLRFSGHPDPSLQQRAQVVYRLLEEAARALEDDRRRAEYARHLLD